MIRKVFLSAILLLFCLQAFPQESLQQREEYLYWESVLDAYEDFANAREDLRGQRKAAETLREKQLQIENLLKHPVGKMTAQQQLRFNAISVRSGLPFTLPVIREEKASARSEVLPSVKTSRLSKPKSKAKPVSREDDNPVQTDGVLPRKQLLVGGIDVLRPDIHPSLERLHVSFPIMTPKRFAESKSCAPWHYSLFLRCGFSPQLQVGLMAGASHPSGFGCYVSWQMHPSFIGLGKTYVADNPDRIWANGKSSVKEQSARAGLLFGKGPLIFYLGAGYGNRRVFWQDSDQDWALIPSYSFSSVSVEAGGMIPLGRLCLSLGVESLAFKTMGVTAGIGIGF